MSINLLPWREKKQFNHGLVVIASISIICLIFFCGFFCYYLHLFSDRQIEERQNVFWQKKNKHLPLSHYLEEKKELQNLLIKIENINNFRQKQVGFFLIWQTLIQSMSPSIRLTELNFSKEKIILKGESTQTQAITIFIEKIQKNLFSHVMLLNIGHKENEGKNYKSIHKTLIFEIESEINYRD